MEILANDETFVKKSEQAKTRPDGLVYCIVRTYSAGVWAGYVDFENFSQNMKVYEARRLWRWWSEFTLSSLAKEGIRPGKENENKYAMPVDVVALTQCIEAIPCSEKAKNQIISLKNYYEKV